jgi:hypothetical protein
MLKNFCHWARFPKVIRMGVALKTFERGGYPPHLVWDQLVNAAEIWNKYSRGLYKIVLYQDWKEYGRLVQWKDFKEDGINTIALVEQSGSSGVR